VKPLPKIGYLYDVPKNQPAAGNIMHPRHFHLGLPPELFQDCPNSLEPLRDNDTCAARAIPQRRLECVQYVLVGSSPIIEDLHILF
jgi:hypothetical protein